MGPNVLLYFLHENRVRTGQHQRTETLPSGRCLGKGGVQDHLQGKDDRLYQEAATVGKDARTAPGRGCGGHLEARPPRPVTKGPGATGGRDTGKRGRPPEPERPHRHHHAAG